MVWYSHLFQNFPQAAARAGTLSATERSYPTSEVRGSGLKCQAAMAQERPREATLCLRSVVAGRGHPRPRSGAAGRSHLAPEARGGDPKKPPGARGQGRQLRGATQGVVAAQAQEGLEELSHVEGQEGRR